MITSDPRAAELRPALAPARETYRAAAPEVVSAAARAGVAFPVTASPLALDTSQYEFPGDRTYLRFKEGGMP